MDDRREVVSAFAATVDGNEAVPYEPATEDLPDIDDPETPEDAEAKGAHEEWKFWDGQITAGLTYENRWRMEAEECEASYFGPDNDPGRGGDRDSGKSENQITDKTALIHANIDVLAPLVYSETPQPVVRRRFYGDGKVDETGLMAAEVGQRFANYLLDTTDFDVPMMNARNDWLIAGRATARVLYKARFETVTEVVQRPHPRFPGVTIPEEVTSEKKTGEEVLPRATEWRRFLCAPASSWDEMPWVAVEVPMTRTKVSKRFGQDVADQMSFDTPGMKDKARGMRDDEDDGFSSVMPINETGARARSPFDTAMVWEIWSAETQEVIWWSANYNNGVLDKRPDILGLERFYPFPRPLTATVKGQSLTPRPDIKYYEQRADEIDLATKKMKVILDALSVSGLFPGDMQQEVKKLLNGKNEMIPVSAWLQFIEKGGSLNLIQWLPIEAMIKAVQALSTMRREAKDAMFEASGVSDVMRASTDPSETATAQKIKGRYAGLRLSDKQRRMAIFALETLQIMMEIGLEHFDTQTIADITGLDLPMTRAEREAIAMQAQLAQQQFQQDMQMYDQLQQLAAAGVQFGQMPPAPTPPPDIEIPKTSYEEVHDRLRSDFGRKITINIETQSTILADEQADKEARIEFLGAFSQFVQQLAPMMQSGVFDMKTAKELLLFGVRGFPKSRTLESMIAALPDEPQGQEQQEDTQVTVAKIRAEVDKEIEAMQQANNDKERAHEKEIERMKIGGDLVSKAADAMTDQGEPPEAPQAQGAEA
ncbi:MULTISPECIES: hypothetical protein [unclassified Mameliella]|uniref:hypothetical protein n=1 Tax=unclassified Mameliella TaxID=2630630 RepID=UPI0027402997|nr:MULTISPECIES: hypothetical protein [unclassified Mameliella]